MWNVNGMGSGAGVQRQTQLTRDASNAESEGHESNAVVLVELQKWGNERQGSVGWIKIRSPVPQHKNPGFMGLPLFQIAATICRNL